MAGLKSLFRRKSKKDLHPDRSSTPTPSPGRSHSSAGVRAQTPTPSSLPPVPQLANATPTQNRSRMSQGGFSPNQQSPSSPVAGSAAIRYDQMPTGATPERGTYPIHGNGGQGFQNGQVESQTRDSRSNSAGRPAGGAGVAHNISRRSIPPGTAVSSQEGYTERQRSASQSSAYTDRSRHADGPNGQGYGQPEDIPPVPSAPLDSYKRSTIGTLPDGNPTASHNRVISSSSAISAPRTPIADQKNTTKTAANVGNGSVSEPYERNTTTVKANNRDDFNVNTVADRSAALGRAVDSSDRTGYATSQQQQQRAAPVQTILNDSLQTNGDVSAASKTRRQSIPRKSLEKPLPVPNEMPPAAPASRSNVRDGETLPVRERISAGSSLGTSQQPPSSPDSAVTPSSPVRSGKYVKSPTHLSKGEIRTGPQQIYDRSYLVQGAASPPSLQGVVDLNNTVDTTTHVHYAPAVIHETVLPHVHHIREEQITREIHGYDVHHRILPVVDVQVLPPKHIVRTDASVDGQWVEVAEELVPGRYHQNWIIAETVSKIPGQLDRASQAPRQFTARAFPGTEGDYREYVNENGVPTTETTWIHPPTISVEARRRGLTLPLDME